MTTDMKKLSVGISRLREKKMQSDENDVFDDSVDPYDRSIDFEYDDGIADVPSDEFEEAEDDANWDSHYEDEHESESEKITSSDEMADYDALED